MDKLMYPYIDQLIEPPILGETYMVPCYKEYTFIPLINNSHTDYETGQYEAHYHIDFRFVNILDLVRDYHSLTFNTRIKSSLVDQLYYRPLVMINEEQQYVTNPQVIANTKLSYNKIHKHKCPHRGFDLRQVKPKDGCITCPLHGLKFRADTHELIR